MLVVFTAAWSPESTAFEQQVLVAPESEAVLAACFEAVKVDVDQRPGLAKRLQVAHVPSACVLGAQDAILARFDCPPSPTAFVAAAARAAQDAAAAGKGSISLVTDKDRQFSDVATTQPAAAAAPPAAAMSESSVGDLPPSRFVSGSATDVPTLPPAAPASWPAEAAGRAPAFTNAAATPPAHRTIEPAAAATPWLSSPPTAGPVPPPAQPESSAVISDQPEKPKSTSTWSAFTAAFQKPFSIFSKPAKAPEPPTLAPARPTSPLAATTPTIVPPPAAPASVPTPAATAAAAPAAPDPYGSMPLGLEGYCPVTLADKGVWTEGRAQWGVRHRGRTYLFAGPEQQQAFLAAPDRYAPALSGDDPVAVVDQGKSLPGRRAFGVTYQSRMYLFSSPETRAQFAANPERYTAPVMLAERAPPVDATRRY